MGNVTTSTTVDDFMQSADGAAARAVLGAPASTTTISAGTGLTGGGDLSANRTLTVSYGTTSGTAAEGNDSRLSNARTPTAHKSTHASGGSDQITSLALTTGTITTTPGSANDIVNKSYADSIGSGVNFHDACDYGTIAVLSPAATYNQPGGAGVGVNATLTGGTNAPLVVDGVTVATGKRILVKNQTSTFQNGIYNVTQQGDGSTVPYILTRASDYDTSGSGTNEVQAGDFVIVLNSTLANTAWVQQTPAPINFGVTAITFIQFAAANAGVTSFNTSLSGLTPSSNTTGTVTLAGTLGVGSGGTGATTQQAALNALSGAQTSGYYFRSDGTNVSLQPMSVADVTAGTLGIANGGTGATTNQSAISSLGVGMRMVEVQTTGNIVGTMNTGVSPNTFTVTATGVFTTDGYTPVLGDIIAFTLQTTITQNGFWEVTTVGAVGVSAVFTRPSWFTGTVRNGMYMTRFGASQSGYVMALYNSTQNADIVVGTSAINVIRVSYRNQNATTGANVFGGRQTFRANSTADAPFSFAAGAALMTTPVAHYVEWFNDQMYLTNAAGVRTTNTNHVAIPATATSSGQVGQIAVDNTGSWLYVCTATNVWKRVLLTTF